MELERRSARDMVKSVEAAHRVRESGAAPTRAQQLRAPISEGNRHAPRNHHPNAVTAAGSMLAPLSVRPTNGASQLLRLPCRHAPLRQGRPAHGYAVEAIGRRLLVTHHCPLQAGVRWALLSSRGPNAARVPTSSAPESRCAARQRPAIPAPLSRSSSVASRLSNSRRRTSPVLSGSGQPYVNFTQDATSSAPISLSCTLSTQFETWGRYGNSPAMPTDDTRRVLPPVRYRPVASTCPKPERQHTVQPFYDAETTGSM